MRILGGLENPREGILHTCSPNILEQYFAQNQEEQFDMTSTALDAVQEVAQSDTSLTEIRNLLGKFMFKGEDVYKKISLLSGGEKTRLAICRMMLSPSNLLLLDEVSLFILQLAFYKFIFSINIFTHIGIFILADKSFGRHCERSFGRCTARL